MRIYTFMEIGNGKLHKVKAMDIYQAFKLCPQANGMILIGVMPYSSKIQMEVK